jgi:diguanylate cyclase (GGDEF)-like protein
MTKLINNNLRKSGQTAEKSTRGHGLQKKTHSWPELVGLILIAGIAFFVIFSIEKIAADLSSYEQGQTSQTPIQLERFQLRLESVQKIMQLSLIDTESSALKIAHQEVSSIQQQLSSLLPQQTPNNPLEALFKQSSTELAQIESLLRTSFSLQNSSDSAPAPVLRLISRKIDTLLDKTQVAIRTAVLNQSTNASAQSQLIKDFSEYSSLFLTIFGLFAAGLLGLALYQRQLFASQLNANKHADQQTQKLYDTIEGFPSACALFDSTNALQSCNGEFLKLLPKTINPDNTHLTNNTILQLLKSGVVQSTHITENLSVENIITLKRTQKAHELIDVNGHNLLIDEHPTRDGGLMCIYRDISYIHTTENRLEYIDSHDKLTQLPNRNRFLEALDEALGTARIAGKEVAIAIYDIHNFREINDTYGHIVGDRVLQMIAKTLQQETTPDQYTARIGGDEFATFQENLNDHASVELHAQEILSKLRNGFTLDNNDIAIQASAGIAYYPSHGKTLNSLLNNADTARVFARKNTLTHAGIYNNKLKHNTERRRLIERELYRAIELDELRIQYQPQIDVSSGMTMGMEALIRWNNRKMGEVSPAEFIPYAEDNGLILELGEWVLKRAISDYQQLARYGMSPGILSINLSRRQFNSNNIASTLEEAIGKAGLTPQQLTLEITETAIMDDTQRTANILNELKEMGVSLSIDDFGVGYSSFAALREFPIDEVKIDRLFVKDVVSDTSSQEIIRAIIDVAHALNAEVVAEGIENRQQFEMVKKLGCHRAQGFFLCEPVEATTLPDVCLGGKSIPAS